ncbi:hypothetical protein Patl1_33312 [Pistacia atlantica]|uniref:Uncharacterized protein n=1 Tax=Pistacia atlantica TaxID=434234 RepID=A0ACC0ZUT2_9ROSI|nr:hypothetical protein Patl1_33312 [Pistacia atlantica]
MPSLAPFDINGMKEERQATTFDMVLDGSDLVGHARTDYKKEEMEIVMCAARLCLSHLSSRRPTMKTDLKKKPKYLPTITIRWYAKRFLHPDIVAAYEYIFIWDEDLGVEHFNGEKFTEEKPG